MSAQHERLFVYGTLLQGEPNHHYLRNALLLGSDFVSGRFYHSDDGYPVLKLERNTRVWGEIYAVPGKDFEELDRLEGTPGLFQRVRVEIGGRPAWIYVGGKHLQNQCRHPINSQSWLLTCHYEDPLSALGAGIAFEKGQLARSRLTPPADADNFIWMPGDSPSMLVMFPFQSHKQPRHDGSSVLATGVAVHCAYGAHLCYAPWESAANWNFFFSRLVEVLRKKTFAVVVELQRGSGETGLCVDAGPQPRMPWLSGNTKAPDMFQSACALYGLPAPRIEHSAQPALVEQVALQLQIPAIRVSLGGGACRSSNSLSALLPLVQSLEAFTKQIAGGGGGTSR